VLDAAERDRVERALPCVSGALRRCEDARPACAERLRCVPRPPVPRFCGLRPVVLRLAPRVPALRLLALRLPVLRLLVRAPVLRLLVLRAPVVPRRAVLPRRDEARPAEADLRPLLARAPVERVPRPCRFSCGSSASVRPRLEDARVPADARPRDEALRPVPRDERLVLLLRLPPRLAEPLERLPRPDDRPFDERAAISSSSCGPLSSPMPRPCRASCVPRTHAACRLREPCRCA